MNWKDLSLIFLVALVAILAYDAGLKPLLFPKPKNSTGEESGAEPEAVKEVKTDPAPAKQ